MFRRINVRKAIGKGDLEKLKEALERDSTLVNRPVEFYYSDGGYYFSGSLLHLAALFNQPEIIDFLVTEKGMDVNGQMCKLDQTPLHMACKFDLLEAAEKLTALNANMKQKDFDGFVPESYGGIKVREFFRRLRKESSPPPVENEEPRKEEPAVEPVETTVRDDWSSERPDEVVFTREIDSCRLTNVFNFTAKTWTSIARDLSGDHLTVENRSFADTTEEMIAEARAQLDKLNAADAPAAEAAAKPAEEKPAAAPVPKIRFGA